jgi:PAS domain-containing protein
MSDQMAGFSAQDFLNSIGARIDGFMYRGYNSNDYAMTWLSDGFARLTGYDAAAFIRDRTGFASLILKEDLPKVDAAVADAMARGGNWQVSYRIRHRDGRILYVHETGGGSASLNPETNAPEFLDGIILESGAMTRLAERLSQGAAAVTRVDNAAEDIRSTLKTLRLLALNARIEAARANEYGKGFGVVAQEMTSLADRGEAVTSRMTAELGQLRGAISM